MILGKKDFDPPDSQYFFIEQISHKAFQRGGFSVAVETVTGYLKLPDLASLTFGFHRHKLGLKNKIS
ncbi:hypothetical protein D6853_01135 [Butyrivibrio sp. X503]|nr:hypothetical protein D6853_01135 [Butyrivibrio sp. X503]